MTRLRRSRMLDFKKVKSEDINNTICSVLYHFTHLTCVRVDCDFMDGYKLINSLHDRPTIKTILIHYPQIVSSLDNVDWVQLSKVVNLTAFPASVGSDSPFTRCLSRGMSVARYDMLHESPEYLITHPSSVQTGDRIWELVLSNEVDSSCLPELLKQYCSLEKITFVNRSSGRIPPHPSIPFISHLMQEKEKYGFSIDYYLIQSLSLTRRLNTNDESLTTMCSVTTLFLAGVKSEYLIQVLSIICSDFPTLSNLNLDCYRLPGTDDKDEHKNHIVSCVILSHFVILTLDLRMI
jgi:hypothetical protein